MYRRCFCVQWRSKGGKWGHVPRDEGLGGASTLYSAILKREI